MTANRAAKEFGTAFHTPVLVDEVIGLLGNAKTVLDGTLGGGGHSEALLEAGARVTGIDRDTDALASARKRLERFEKAGRFLGVQGNYADAAEILREKRFDAILLDLGVSSHQFDAADRGFTFREGAPLDMRMDRDGRATAADLLNTEDENALTGIFREYADERRGARLAREIIRRRTTESFATSDHFVRAIRGALGPRTGPSDFARLFQALRIAVNDEFEGLRRALPSLRDLLSSEGTIAVITYHSGEDRLVKHTFREWSVGCVCPPRQPICTCGAKALGMTLTKRATTPIDVEISKNPRARSAKLRAWRKA
jgi:16S rRNA (cytosine1402-N4)-methyltransferase